MIVKCLIKKNSEETPEHTLYDNVKLAYERIKARAESEVCSVGDYTIIPIEIDE